MDIDKKLIRSCIKNDRKAQFALYKVCYQLLMNVCYRYKKDKSEAEAIMNQGFLKIVTNLDKYNENVPFEAWSRKIMINTVIDEYRKTKKDKETIEYADFQESTYDQHYIDYNEADKQYNAEELKLMLLTLPDMSRKVFNLYAIDGYSHKEIAEMFSISIGTSKWHVSFTRTELKKLIELKLNPVELHN
ncbi:MAG: RNA polymerase sigma factor [Flavobacteriales bacterium]|nr:RNA polymerase sigma factor [Flavobacteriales bacterium]